MHANGRAYDMAWLLSQIEAPSTLLASHLPVSLEKTDTMVSTKPVTSAHAKLMGHFTTRARCFTGISR